MSLKSIFEKSKQNIKVQSFRSLSKFVDEDVESVQYIEEYIKDRQRFKPPVDYLTASNFAFYGSLEEYYQSSINRIQEMYPYDGSLKEKLQYFNESSGFDFFMFENLYPRTNGYIEISANSPGGDGWGNVLSVSGAYGNPENKEYIYIKGGPNVGNVYNTASNQTSNLEIDGIYGNTVEFWLKKGEYVDKTQREVIFDVHTTGVLGDSHKYGRLTVELDSSGSSESPFMLTYRSGSRGLSNVRCGTLHLHNSASDDSWHHYAFTFKNLSGSVQIKTYVDGELNKTQVTGSSIGSLNTPLIGAIGSLVANKVDKGEVVATSPGLGYGKLSGSLDEFRYWKIARNSRQIRRFWMTNVGAGANTDLANTPLGLYYKFNEGITGRSSIDKRILDYSGRVSNGNWVGYRGYGRYTKSAIVESSASFKEFKDPILYKEHPDVERFTRNYLERGYAYDLDNNSSLYHTMPNWIVDEDGDRGDLKKITQIMASYFDNLRLQIKEFNQINKVKYMSFDHKPYPFNDIRLESMGFTSPDIFLDSNVLNVFLNRSEDQHFKQDLSDVKNYIYNNIHSNLESIYKSKGTEKSFRNLFRCFGIDEDLIKIKVYSKNTEYPIETSYTPTSVKTKYVNFSTDANKDATVFQNLKGLDTQKVRFSDCRGYITGSEGLVDAHTSANLGLTTEASVFFPTRYPITHPFFFETPVSASLFGCHSVRKKTGTPGATDSKTSGVFTDDGSLLNWTSESDDHANFQVYSVKEKKNSKNAKFVLTCRNNLFEPMESDYYADLYDSNKWHISVKVFPEDFDETAAVSGSTANMKVGFYGVSVVGDAVESSFYLTQSITNTVAQKISETSKRFYVGSHWENYDQNLLQHSDVKIANFRHWSTHLSNEEIDAHAIDASNYGVINPNKNLFSLQNFGNLQIPKIKFLSINWDFNNLTGSNSNGEMFVTDVSSGSVSFTNTYGSVSQIFGRIHNATGKYFQSSTTASVDVEYESAVKMDEMENVRSSDMVRILSNDDETFTRETRPQNYFYSFEKSMYDVISTEMLNFFAGIKDFNNLIGAPVERYRTNYKGLEKLRQIFFQTIKNDPDIERYTEYYKWLDSSLSIMIDQLVPAVVDASDDIRNVIQSHVLERAKYFNKFPTAEKKVSEPIGHILGINELTYDWQHGHAPLGDANNTNCLWTRERAQRSTDKFVTSSVSSVDSDREVIRRVGNTFVSGSTYAIRKLSRPYKLSVEDQRHAKGGDNTFGNKKKRFFTGVSTAHGLSHISVTGSDASSDACKDIINPSKKRKFKAAADIAFTHKDRDINDIAPFTLYSSSIDAPTDYKKGLYDGFKQGVDVTNLHSDEYGDDREVTLQSPFTERWVGGNQHRHQDLSGSLRAPIEAKRDGKSRLEAFKILAEGGKLYVLPPNATGIDDSNLPIIDPHIQHAQILREDLAKRPVNIRNIATTTGSVSLGNYNHTYDVVQYTTEDQRKDFLVENLEQMTSSNSSAIPGVKEFSKFYRPTRKSVFKARFAAPGGTEVAGDSRGGHSIDRETNQYSVYNSVNYRNLSVRGPLDFLSKIPQTGSKDSNSLVTNHKINANPRYRLRMSDAVYTGEVDKNMDNVFIQHPIPQNDYQYSWITASLREGIDTAYIGGHLHSFTQAANGDTTGSLRYERTYEFLTASNRVGKNIIDFAGLNTYIRDNLDTGTNTTTTAQYYNLTGTIHHRQGPYGWPSWKQVRASLSQMGRYLKRNNIFAPPIAKIPEPSGFGLARASVKFSSGGSYSWPPQDSTQQAEASSLGRIVSDQNYRFVDPPVSSNRYPMQMIGSVVFKQVKLKSGITTTTIETGEEFVTYNNLHTDYANKSLSALLGRDKTVDNLKFGLSQRKSPQQRNVTETMSDFLAIDQNSRLNYSFSIFPKEKNSYLKKTRQRTEYKSDDFWKKKDRILTNITNSQGNYIPKLSVWPLDGNQNFGSTAISNTTSPLGSSGQGELLADYSVFHNNRNHPSASALYARPFPLQSKTSLPNLSLIEFSNTISWSKYSNPIFDSDVDYNDNNNLYEIYVPSTQQKEGAQDVTGSVLIGNVPPGLENNLGEQSDSGDTPTGPRVYNSADNQGHVPMIALIGDSSNMGTGSADPAFEADLPGSSIYTHYRFLQTTGSILGESPLMIDFHLKTGDDTASRDNFGLYKAQRPFYVQVRGDDDDGGYTTIFKITTDQIDDYAGASLFKKVSIVSTASFGANQQVRFVAPTDASEQDDWGIIFLNIFTGSNLQRQSSIATTDFTTREAQAFIDRTTLSASSENFLEKTVTFSKVSGDDFLDPSADMSQVSFRDLRNFADVRAELVNGDFYEGRHETFNNYNYYIKPSSESSKLVRTFAKNEKLDHFLYGTQFYRVPIASGRDPFNYSNYDDWARQSRLKVKDYSIVPEFRISDHMDHYVNTVGGTDPFFSCNREFLSITGAVAPNNSSQDNFYETYSHSEFMRYFDVVQDELSDNNNIVPSRLTLECKAFKKFLPYKGFYPADRMTQLASEFSSSYSQYVTGGHWRNVLAPYYAPGIGFNSIKSGLAVDYPVIEPNPDRDYNQFGVMFQSSSLAVDTSGFSGAAVKSKNGIEVPLVSGDIVSTVRSTSPELSRNRIEIAGGTEWAKTLTGSISGGGTHFVASFWMYLPIGTPHNNGTTYGIGHIRQKGVLFSFGGSKEGTAQGYQTGLHVGYHNAYDTSNWSSKQALTNAEAPDKDPDIHFYVMGGDGTKWFLHSTTDSTPRMRHGWNHIYLELDLTAPSHTNFKIYANTEEYTSKTEVTKSSGLSSYTSGIVDMRGHRNCFIGNNLEEVKRKNTAGLSSLYPPDYDTSSGDLDGVTDAAADLLKPSEVMLTEVCIFNKPLTEEEIKNLSGFKTPPTLSDITNQNQDFRINGKIGQFRGPSNPYQAISNSKAGNLVAWYRPGNDTGWTSKSSHNSNGLVVFNHAQPLYSGEIISQNSGALDHYSGVSKNPIPLNHLSGNMYGFTEWTGSVTTQSSWTGKLRQTWNGVVDCGNAAQYTLCYHRPKNGRFKTWFNYNQTKELWFKLGVDSEHYVERNFRLSPVHKRNVLNTLTMVTGAIKVPTFIVGNKQNFTDDSSIPRIGSASYGTMHYLANGNDHGEDPVYSQGWVDRTDTGIKNLTRIPFEAIIKPSLFTPPMKDDGDINTAVFYEIEPHPSASLLSHYNRKRKYVGQNDHGQQSVKWTDTEFDSGYKTDENFSYGVAKDSEAMKSELDLESAKGNRIIYDLAADNYYAEVMNFFLNQPQGVTIRSSDSLNSSVDTDRTYKMTIQLNRGHSGRDNPMYNNPAAFGVPFDAGRERPKDQDEVYKNRTDELRGYGFSPYLPPHYDGFARAIYTFTPDPVRVYRSIKDVMEDTSVEFARMISSTGSVGGSGILARANTSIAASYNRKYAMHLSESFYGLNKDSEYSFVNTIGQDGNPIPDQTSLVIQSKFECPSFDFTKVKSDQPRTDQDVQVLPNIKGMWHQDGDIDSNKVPNIEIIRPKHQADLADLLGMKVTGENRLGALAERKTISEAVVAVPFMKSGNQRKYFYLPPDEVYQAVRELGYENYKRQTPDDILRYTEVEKYINTLPGNVRYPRLGVRNMVKSMLKYNIPPQFNFLKYNQPKGKYIKPFVMYMFEFSAELTRKDLARIWQNTTPDVGMDFYGRSDENLVMESKTVTHELFSEFDLLSDPLVTSTKEFGNVVSQVDHEMTGFENGFNGELQWLVFKVKQKAESSYFRKKELDRLPDGHPEKTISVENDLYNYGFNWPYDYFSLVELVNIKATTQFSAPKDKMVSDRTAEILKFRKENLE